MDVLVVGAGPGGLLSSYALLRRGFNVEVHEEHDRVGLPRHCSGLVSSYVIKSLESLAKPHIINAFDEYRVRILKDGVFHDALTLSFRESVYLIDRVEFEASLLEIVEGYGGKVVLKSRVTSVDVGQASVKTKQGLVRSNLLIVGEGATGSLLSAAGLCVRKKTLVGPQALVRLGRVPDAVEVIVSPIFGPEGFGWVIPSDEGHAIVGLLTASRTAGSVLEYLIRKVGMCSQGATVERFFGGLVPADRPCKEIAGERHAIVGDAASLVKPVTKGGLYPLVEEVRALSDSMESGGYFDVVTFNSKYRKILRILSTQRAVLDIIRGLGGYCELVELMVKLGLEEVRVLDYDRLTPDLTSLPFALNVRKRSL